MVTEQQQKLDRWAITIRNVRENARNQSTPECRENYLRSCESHGGELAEIVAIVRRELTGIYEQIDKVKGSATG